MTIRFETLCVAVLVAGAATPVFAADGGRGDPLRGKPVYDKWCLPCHDAGRGHPGTESLQFKYQGSMPAVLLERRDLTREAVATFVRQGVLLMAPFRKTEISDAELADLTAYVTDTARRQPRRTQP